MGNLLWLIAMVVACTASWFVPHWYSPVVVMCAWVGGTWWGYLTAYGESR